MPLHPFKAGLALGAVTGLFHLFWASVVLLGWAGPLLNFILRLHFLVWAVSIAPFDAGTAAALVGLTFAIGFVGGAVFAWLWNRLHQTS